MIVKSAGRAVVVGLVLALLSACSLLAPTPPNAPTLPAEQFPPSPDRGADVYTSIEGLAADGADVVALGEVHGRVDRASFWWSPNAGATWEEGHLSTAAAEATQIAESVQGFAAVSVREDGRLWLGLGRKDDDLIAWTSADGRTWERSVMTGLDPRRASFGQMRGTPDGFVLVGSLWDEQTDVSTPTVWRSTDGVGVAGGGAGRRGAPGRGRCPG